MCRRLLDITNGPARFLALALLPAWMVGGQARQVDELLAAGRLSELGRLLAPLDVAGKGIGTLGASGGRLLALPGGQLDQVLAGLRTSRGSRPEGPLSAVLQAMKQSGSDPVGALPVLRPLLADATLRRVVSGPAGRAAMQLCRSGRAVGATILQELLGYYPEGWAWANLGNGLRFLGRYKDAAQAYQQALAIAGQHAWILNDLGMLEQARGHRDGALRLYRQGVLRATAGSDADKDTCRTNAALLLAERGEAGDRERARILLEIVVGRDPERLRAGYWLAQMRRTGKSARLEFLPGASLVMERKDDRR